jgi:probable rRNA maturation factor
VEALVEDARWEALDLEGLAERAARATLERLGLEPLAYEISLLGCSDKRIAELNEDFRGKPQPTNVLSWPSEERGAGKAGEMPHLPAPAPPVPLGLGDVAIAFDTCEREAREAGKPLPEHALHLLVHGTLHLLGFDHERDADAELMEGSRPRSSGGSGLRTLMPRWQKRPPRDGAAMADRPAPFAADRTG